jgi:hypothetical protein
MPSTSGVGDNPSSQPKVQLTTKTWDSKIGPTIIGGEVHETQWIIQDFIGCFAFNLKELGQLKRQEIQIILEDDNLIFRQTYKLTHSQVTGWNPLEGLTKSSCGSWDLEARSRLPTLKRGRRSSWEPGIRLGRRFSRSSMNLHQNKPPMWLVHISGHPWVLGQATGTLDHETHHSPNSGVSHHLTPYSILCSLPPRLHPNGTFCWDSQNGVSKLSQLDSRNFERP